MNKCGSSGAPLQHPPLRRVSRRVSRPTPQPVDDDQMVVFNATVEPPTPTTTTTQGSGGDSCYSSCSEESLQHGSLSREASGTGVDSADYARLVDFATKLGYSEWQLQSVLETLGASAALGGQDRILTELIKLGKGPVPLLSKTPPPSDTTVVADEQPQLRSIVIDGSNLAITHGRKEIFSCIGIRDCVNFFRDRGHLDIKVFVPQFRRETARSDCPITDQHILLELETEGVLVWTPSRRVGGRRIVCHDDRYILKTAADKDAVIVSNDEYRDLIRENPQYRRLVDERLLMYSFVDGRFMPPDDPLGRTGPRLDQFLCKGGCTLPATQILCPYGRKCTYGNKCKYAHPERGPGNVHVSVTERLLRKQCLSARPSLFYEQQRTTNTTESNRLAVGRTQSLNVPMTISVDPAGHHHNYYQQHPPSTHPPRAPLSHDSTMNRRVGSPLLSVPHMWEHQSLNRNLSAPVPVAAQSSTWLGAPFDHRQRGCQTSISETNLVNYHDGDDYHLSPSFTWRNLSAAGSTDSALGSDGHLFVPSTAVWGESELSVGPVSPMRNLSDMTSTRQSDTDISRLKLQYHLSQVFPEASVLAVMDAHPDETDAKKLCAMIMEVKRSG